MKKLYTSLKWKRHSRRRSERELKKRREKKDEIRRRNLRFEIDRKYYIHEKGKRIKGAGKERTYKIDAPSHFSIKDNIDEMLEFFDDISHNIKNKRKIFIDMLNVNRITADSIIYMLTQFEFFQKKYELQSIQGNYPSNEKCRNLLLGSGFLKYVQSKDNFEVTNEDVFAIRDNKLVFGLIAKNVIDFSVNKLNKRNGKNTKGIYTTLIESMANTKQHAYRTNRILPKWWLIAFYNKDDNRVNFTFLDTGEGIPNTIRRDLFREILLSKLVRKQNDGELILSALNGKFRTRTKKRYRGRGLPKILDHNKNKQIDNLIIISNKGYVVCNEMKPMNLKRRFHGSLLSWDFI